MILNLKTIAHIPFKTKLKFDFKMHYGKRAVINMII